MSARASRASEASTSDLSVPVCASCGNAKPTPTDAPCCDATGRTRPAGTTCELWHENIDGSLYRSRQAAWALMAEPQKAEPFLLTSSVADSPAKTSQSPDDEQDSQATDPACSSSSHESRTLFSATEDGSSLRTFPDFFPPTVDGISPSYSRRWPSSGFTTSPGVCWTADTSECPSGAGAFSSLADVLLDQVPARFFLSPRAAAGILRRAAKRDRDLPEHLQEALQALAVTEWEQTKPQEVSSSASTPRKTRSANGTGPQPSEPAPISALSENQRAEVLETPYARQLTSGGGKPGQGYPAARIGSQVRRLTPTECERLQGFPDGWTIPNPTAPGTQRWGTP